MSHQELLRINALLLSACKFALALCLSKRSRLAVQLQEAIDAAENA